jgi:signal transduction histidine kinase
MIALGMRLGRVESRLGRGDTDAALALVRESRDEAREIVQELRELVRGIHPPALDAGLEPALATLAARGALPTTVRVELEERPAASVETMLYFAAAELLTNAAKHSGAQHIAVTVLGVGGSLRLLVTDDGCGGASPDGTGSGLRGLAERVRTVDGRLGIDSPPGGPTTISVELEGR